MRMFVPLPFAYGEGEGEEPAAITKQAIFFIPSMP